jgi:hypothetical protein
MRCVLWLRRIYYYIVLYEFYTLRARFGTALKTLKPKPPVYRLIAYACRVFLNFHPQYAFYMGSPQQPERAPLTLCTAAARTDCYYRTRNLRLSQRCQLRAYRRHRSPVHGGRVTVEVGGSKKSPLWISYAAETLLYTLLPPDSPFHRIIHHRKQSIRKRTRTHAHTR